MKASAIQVNWHDKQPVYSVDFELKGDRFATAGGDNTVRLWKLCDNGPEYRATLSKHQRPVNCVRFSPVTGRLASAGDGGLIILWKQVDHAGVVQLEDEDSKEHWIAAHIFRMQESEDIYDISWSSDEAFLMAAMTDNGFQLWDVKEGKCLRAWRDHSHFVQGVAWDPLNFFAISVSSDRSANVYRVCGGGGGGKILSLVTRIKYVGEEGGGKKGQRMFLDETLVSFFRRPSFSPDGSLAVLPAGVFNGENAVFVYSRKGFLTGPLAVMTGFEKPVIGVRFNHLYYLRNDKDGGGFASTLEYKFYFAVYTQNAVVIYDTSLAAPFAFVKNVHLSSLTDAAWSPCGKELIISSIDGYVSRVSFDESELGLVVPPPSFLDPQKRMNSEKDSSKAVEDLLANTDPAASSKTTSSKTDSASSSKIDPTTSSKIDPTTSSKVDPTASSKIDLGKKRITPTFIAPL